MKYCKNCGQQNANKSQYCSRCGECLVEEVSTKEETVKFCPFCGSKTEDIYCSSCGAHVKNGSLDKGNMVVDKEKASKLKKKKTIKKNRKFKNCVFAGVFLVIVALLANWIVQETIIKSKRQKDCVEWVRYSENGMVGFKDREGNIKLKAQYINTGNYAENGLTKVVGENHLWGYMDYNGEMVIKPQFEGAADFASNGLAKVHGGYINEKGEIVKNPQSRNILSVSYKENGDTKKYGYINKKEKYVINAQFANAHDFTDNGLAKVTNRDTNESGYINAKGEYVLQVAAQESFCVEGLALVRKGEKQVYINAKGEYVEDKEDE